MQHRSSPPLGKLPPRVSAQTDAAKRIAAMLDRWDAENVEDEPDWDVQNATRTALRLPNS